MPSQIHLLRRLIRLISYPLPLRLTPMVAPLTSIIKPYSTVTFDRQRGKWWVRSTKKKTVLSGCTVIKPKNPTNVGLTFVNWYTDSALTIPFDFTTPITTNITLYAGWSATVRFDLRGGTGNDGIPNINDQSVFSGRAITKPKNPTNVGLALVNWYTDSARTIPFDFTTPITTNITLYAGWSATVRFDLRGGTGNDGIPNINDQSVFSGRVVTKPKNTPTKEDYSWRYDRDDQYTFVNWYMDEKLNTPFDFTTPITTDTTLYAGWGHTVRFDLRGGTGNDGIPNINDQSVLSGRVVTKPKNNPTKTGRTFVGWYTDSAPTIPKDITTEKITTHTTFYAGWSVTWRTVAAGAYHTVNIQTDGTLWAWGYNYYAGLGLGDEDNRIRPQQVGSDTWRTVAAGEYHTVGIKKDGTLWAWGYDRFGQLGLGNKGNRPRPKQVGMATNWSMAAAGDDHTIGIQTDGSLWAWGRNGNGQLGLGDEDNRYSPKQIGTDTWLAVAAGEYHTIGIKKDGSLWAWGKNDNGQLGLGDEDNRTRPQQVGTDTWKTADAEGDHTVGIQTDGSLWTWGYNRYGQLGTGKSGKGEKETRPQQVGTDTWKAAAAGYWHTVGIRNDGTPFTWGYNRYGQLGTGDTTQYTTPKQLQQIGTDTWKAVDAGAWHTVGIQTDGILWAWGKNDNGQLGLGDDKPRTSPTVVLEDPTTL